MAARGGLVARRWHCPWGHRPVPRGVLRDGDKHSASWGYLRKFPPSQSSSRAGGGGDGDDGAGGHGLCWERGRRGDAGSGPCQAQQVQSGGQPCPWGCPQKALRRGGVPPPQTTVPHGAPPSWYTHPGAHGAPVGNRNPLPSPPPAETWHQNQPWSPPGTGILLPHPGCFQGAASPGPDPPHPRIPTGIRLGQSF